MSSSNPAWSLIEKTLLALVALVALVFVGVVIMRGMEIAVAPSPEIQALFTGKVTYTYSHKSESPKKLFKATEAWCVVTGQKLNMGEDHFVFWKDGTLETTYDDPFYPHSSEISVIAGWDNSSNWKDDQYITVKSQVFNEPDKKITNKADILRYMWKITGCDPDLAPHD